MQKPKRKFHKLRLAIERNWTNLEKIEKKLKELGYDYLSEGAVKIVYANKKHVVKIYNDKDDMVRDCLLKEMPKKMQKFYLKPIVKKNGIMIQKRVMSNVDFPIIELEEYEQNFYRHYRKISAINEKTGDTCDIHVGNVGILNGKPVIFDF
jgi:superoxide dismutase